MEGFIEIIDAENGELIQATHNDILFGNMSTAVALSLIGNPAGFISYIGFGNGAAYVTPTGQIGYKASLGGANSMLKVPTANLYNTIYVKKVKNAYALSASSTSEITMVTDNLATSYSDLQVVAPFARNEPPVGAGSSTTITQTLLDTSPVIGNVMTQTGEILFEPGELVFNEMALYAGTPNLFVGENTVDTADVSAFTNQRTDFSITPGVKSKLMLTHAIFAPTQKAANRAIIVRYTLRVMLGNLLIS